MGAVVGLVIGYVLGTRAGEKGYEELRESWRTITTSEEVKELVSGGLSVLADMVGQGKALLVDRLQGDEPAPERIRAA
jgi:putative ribosome biogenesis GTPase RsgA